jgi:hypothetical protein
VQPGPGPARPLNGDDGRVLKPEEAIQQHLGAGLNNERLVGLEVRQVLLLATLRNGLLGA